MEHMDDVQVVSLEAVRADDAEITVKTPKKPIWQRKERKERAPREGRKNIFTLDFVLKCCFVLFFALALFTVVNILGYSDVFKKAAEESSAGIYEFFKNPALV